MKLAMPMHDGCSSLADGLVGAQRVVVHHCDELGERCMVRQLFEAQADGEAQG